MMELLILGGVVWFLGGVLTTFIKSYPANPKNHVDIARYAIVMVVLHVALWPYVLLRCHDEPAWRFSGHRCGFVRYDEAAEND